MEVRIETVVVRPISGVGWIWENREKTGKLCVARGASNALWAVGGTGEMNWAVSWRKYCLHWYRKRKEDGGVRKKDRERAVEIWTTDSLGIKEHYDGSVNFIYIHITYSGDNRR